LGLSIFDPTLGLNNPAFFRVYALKILEYLCVYNEQFYISPCKKYSWFNLKN